MSQATFLATLMRQDGHPPKIWFRFWDWWSYMYTCVGMHVRTTHTRTHTHTHTHTHTKRVWKDLSVTSWNFLGRSRKLQTRSNSGWRSQGKMTDLEILLLSGVLMAWGFLCKEAAYIAWTLHKGQRWGHLCFLISFPICEEKRKR